VDEDTPKSFINPLIVSPQIVALYERFICFKGKPMPTVIVALLPGDGKGVVDSGSVSHYVWKGMFASGTVEHTM